jgi:hypothetical protein
MQDVDRSAGDRRDQDERNPEPLDPERGLDAPLDPDRPTALPDERSVTGTDPDASARDDDEGNDNVLTREGADAPDAADIEDPDSQL